jgi:hypothetical protein
MMVAGQTVAVVFEFQAELLFSEETKPEYVIVEDSSGHTFRCHYDPWLNQWEDEPLRVRARARVARLWRNDDD